MLTLPAREANAPPASAFRVVVVERAEELAPFIGAWEELSAAAVEPNVFYEPWMLLPALRRLGPFPSARVVLLFAPMGGEPAREALCGLFPLQDCRTETTVRVRAAGLLRHPFCYLRTPLLRAGCAGECLTAFFDWLFTRSGHGLIELGQIPACGPFRQLLAEELMRRGAPAFTVASESRALFLPGSDAEQYLGQALSSRHRRELGRKARRLGEHGELRYQAADRNTDIDAWIEDFMRLEAGGWKGRAETALLSRPETREFFREVMRGAFERHRLMMLRLDVGGRPCAARVAFSEGAGAMAFKLGFDEEFAKCSPGLVLEAENVRRLHEARSVQWMDSGAGPKSRLFNQIWLHRRSVETLLVAGPSLMAALLVCLLPLGRLANRVLEERGIGLPRPPAEAPPDEP